MASAESEIRSLFAEQAEAMRAKDIDRLPTAGPRLVDHARARLAARH